MTKILKNRPTQKQIAEKLGLSAATVSLALRDNPVVAKSTRDLVHQMMRETGYVRNLAAASLRTGRSNIVGVSFPTIAHSSYGDLLLAVERAFEESGTVILINNHEGDIEKLDRFISTLATYGADALMIAPPPDTPASVIERVAKHGMQLLYLGCDVEKDAVSDRVSMDYKAAGAMAASHLIDNGYERLCLIGGQRNDTASFAKMQGFRAAIEEAKLPWDDDYWLPCVKCVREGINEIRTALARDPAPTGIVCVGDTISSVASGSVQQLGLVPGKDVGIVGIGTARGARTSTPPVTMVCGDPGMIGRLGAETIRMRLDDPGSETCRRILEPKLMLGETSGGR